MSLKSLAAGTSLQRADHGPLPGPAFRSLQPIVHYTLLLLLFVVAAYKGVSLALLSATLVGELSSVPFLVRKLQGLAGERLLHWELWMGKAALGGA